MMHDDNSFTILT